VDPLPLNDAMTQMQLVSLTERFKRDLVKRFVPLRWIGQLWRGTNFWVKVSSVLARSSKYSSLSTRLRSVHSPLTTTHQIRGIKEVLCRPLLHKISRQCDFVAGPSPGPSVTLLSTLAGSSCTGCTPTSALLVGASSSAFSKRLEFVVPSAGTRKGVGWG
jgi:hypothetical protein